MPVLVWPIVALILVLFFEAAVHSAHHIGDEEHAAECVIAAVVGDLAGITPDALVLESPFVAVTALDPMRASTAVSSQSRSGPFGRAPPSAA